MSDKKIKAMIANTFLEVADALETGQYGKKPVIGFASEGSEHGQDNIEEAMKIAEMKGLKAVLIEGEDLHKKMEEMLDSGPDPQSGGPGRHLFRIIRLYRRIPEIHGVFEKAGRAGLQPQSIRTFQAPGTGSSGPPGCPGPGILSAGGCVRAI